MAREREESGKLSREGCVCVCVKMMCGRGQRMRLIMSRRHQCVVEFR